MFMLSATGDTDRSSVQTAHVEIKGTGDRSSVSTNFQYILQAAGVDFQVSQPLNVAQIGIFSYFSDQQTVGQICKKLEDMYQPPKDETHLDVLGVLGIDKNGNQVERTERKGKPFANCMAIAVVTVCVCEVHGIPYQIWFTDHHVFVTDPDVSTSTIGWPVLTPVKATAIQMIYWVSRYYGTKIPVIDKDSCLWLRCWSAEEAAEHKNGDVVCMQTVIQKSVDDSKPYPAILLPTIWLYHYDPKQAVAEIIDRLQRLDSELTKTVTIEDDIAEDVVDIANLDTTGQLTTTISRLKFIRLPEKLSNNLVCHGKRKRN
jgi:hypothetical protein